MILSDGLFHLVGQKIHFEMTVKSYFPISVFDLLTFATILFLEVLYSSCILDIVGELEFVVHMP